MNRHSLLYLREEDSFAGTRWTPCADVYKTPAGWLIKFDLAGVPEDDLRVAVQGHQVILEGRRRDRHVEKGARVYSLEIRYSAFRRILRLPESLEGARVTHSLKDGMLAVHIRTEERP